jgi:hypothetical protein
LSPAPASQTEKPAVVVPAGAETSAEDCVKGVRPNSLVNSTSVPSSRPPPQIDEQPGHGRSMRSLLTWF